MMVPGGGKVDITKFFAQDSVLVTLTAAASAGTDEVQTVAIGGSPTGGTFTLTYGGQTTAGIAYNATAAAVQTALQLLSSIGPDNILVTGAAALYTITFVNELGGTNVAPLTGDATGMTGGTPTLTVATVTGGVAGDTTLTVAALAANLTSPTIPPVGQTLTLETIPIGTLLDFGGIGRMVRTTAVATIGDTSISVSRVSDGIPNGSTARYAGAGLLRVTVPSGTVVGRTIAMRDAGTPYRPFLDTDDEIYIVVFEKSDIVRDNNDIELLRPAQAFIFENFLPYFSTYTNAQVNKLRALWSCGVGRI
jgi:hypothetical protein